MKMHWPTLILSSALLAACGGGDGPDQSGGGTGFIGGDGGGGTGGGGGGGGGGGVIDPTSPLAGADTCADAFTCNESVLGVSYDSSSDRIVITGTPFDETPRAATYVPASTTSVPYVNVAGFTAYVNEEFLADPSVFNNYLAYFKTSPDGSVSVGQTRVMDGYRDRGYGGVFYQLNSPANVPTTELATFSGQYAGILVFDGSSESYQTTGDIQFWVDFTDAYVKGWTDNRRTIGAGSASLPDLIFDDAEIRDGAFGATAISLDGDGDVFDDGGYGGVFGGTDAETMGGWFEVKAPEYLGDDSIQPIEIGTFVITKD